MYFLFGGYLLSNSYSCCSCCSSVLLSTYKYLHKKIKKQQTKADKNKIINDKNIAQKARRRNKDGRTEREEKFLLAKFFYVQATAV